MLFFLTRYNFGRDFFYFKLVKLLVHTLKTQFTIYLS